MRIRLLLSLTLWVPICATQPSLAAIIDETLDETATGALKDDLSGNLVTGVLILNEPDGTISDIVSFSTSEGRGTASLLSDVDEAKEFQDGLFEVSQARLMEVINSFAMSVRVTAAESDIVKDGYTPAAGKPGYFQDANGNTPKWVVNSDVPEPSTITLLSVCLICLFGYGLLRRNDTRSGP